ncbi:2Fe-2S iron-sulfur cluster-binding protein [Xanthobacter oligotrophicus]|uniref:2Fe-2S iron-sulfur cluster-binding protein n=1 Tax=Xanthobacter oligotrophicus TaxID=2607286 RepID=A0ABW7A223_9HYPH
MKHEILIADTGESYLCDETESVLAGMARLGRKGIPLGCRGGGCGVCKVAVVDGRCQAGAMSRQHVSEEEVKAGTALACRIRPESRLTLKVVGGLKKAACRPRTPPD